MVKKYIAPSCEIMSLATEDNTLLVTSFNVDPDTKVGTQLSNNRLDNFDAMWDEE